MDSFCCICTENIYNCRKDEEVVTLLRSYAKQISINAMKKIGAPLLGLAKYIYYFHFEEKKLMKNNALRLQLYSITNHLKQVGNFTRTIINNSINVKKCFPAIFKTTLFAFHSNSCHVKRVRLHWFNEKKFNY